VYFDGGSKASVCCILRDRWKKIENRFGLAKHLEKQLAPRWRYTQAASIDSEVCVGY